MWKGTEQECYCDWDFHGVKYQSVSEATDKLNSWREQLLMAADVDWTIPYIHSQLSINHAWSGKYGMWTVIWSL